MALIVNFRDEPFEEFDDFHDWLMEQMELNGISRERIEKSADPSALTKRLPRLSREQVEDMWAFVEDLVTMPKGIYLKYSPKAETIASRYSTSKDCFFIKLTTNFYFFKMFPDIARAGIEHEFGHIFNGDCTRDHGEHRNCSGINKVADVRINAAIDRVEIDRLYRALFYQKDGYCPYVPDRYYSRIGLPVNPDGWSFDIAHNAYHENGVQPDPEARRTPPPAKPKDEPEREKYKEMPVVGDIIMVTGDYGDSYGRVTQVDNDTRDIVVEKMTMEDVYEYFGEITQKDDAIID